MRTPATASVKRHKLKGLPKWHFSKSIGSAFQWSQSHSRMNYIDSPVQFVYIAKNRISNTSGFCATLRNIPKLLQKYYLWLLLLLLKTFSYPDFKHFPIKLVRCNFLTTFPRIFFLWNANIFYFYDNFLSFWILMGLGVSRYIAVWIPGYDDHLKALHKKRETLN